MKKVNHILLVAIAMIMTSTHGLSQDQTDNLKANPLDEVELNKFYKSIANISEANDKCRLGVIYVLGMMSVGNLVEGAKVKEQITKMYPDSIHLQEMSDERVSDICQGCFKASCKRCLGNKSCTLCKGTGRKIVPPSGTGASGTVCAPCSGTGKCGDCKGTGDRTPMCMKCAGRGKVYSTKCKDAYFKLLGIDNVASIEKVPSDPVATGSASLKTAFTPDYFITDSDVQKNYYIKSKQTSANLQKRFEDLWERGLKKNVVQKNGVEVTKSLMYFPIPDGIPYTVKDAKVVNEEAEIVLKVSTNYKGKYIVDSEAKHHEYRKYNMPVIDWICFTTKKTEVAYKAVINQTIYSKGWLIIVFIDKQNMVALPSGTAVPIDEIESFMKPDTTVSSYYTDEKPIAIASCSACGGTKWVTCANCKGTGYISSGNDMLCRTCNGTGVQNGPFKNRCLDCNGTRFMMRRCGCAGGKRPCMQCK